MAEADGEIVEALRREDAKGGVKNEDVCLAIGRRRRNEKRGEARVMFVYSGAASDSGGCSVLRFGFGRRKF